MDRGSETTGLSYPGLSRLRECNAGQKIVFCSGSFDLPHAGHVLFFEDCKKYGDVLVVGIGGDRVIKRLKGEERPILNEHIRLKTISSFRPVDHCIVDYELDPPSKFYFLEQVLEHLRPDVYVINVDAFDIPGRRAMLERYPTELIVLDRWFPPEFEGISTSGIISKIKALS